MLAYAVAWFLMFASTVSVAGMRMLAQEATFSYLTIAGHVALQSMIAGACLWISSLLGPLDAGTIAMTAVMLMAEAAFRIFRKFR